MMLKKALSGSSRFVTQRGTRVGTLIPRKSVSQNEVVPSNVAPVTEPVYLSLTPALKKGRWDPPAEDSVAVLDPTVFKHPIRRDILHLCAVHYRDSLRQGNGSTKTRGEVAGSGRKIQRQKGTGRARVGDAQSPIRRGGGIAFGPKPRDFGTKLPRKVVEMGLRVALSAKLKEDNLGVMTRLQWPNAKTKHLSERIEALGLRKSLFITGETEAHEGLVRAIRNIPHVDLTTVDNVNVYDILSWPRVIMDLKAVEYFEALLRKEVPTREVPLLEEPVTSTLAEASA